MNILTWILFTSFMVTVLLSAVTFHKATVCRQEAWLKSTESVTGTLLFNPKQSESTFLPKCKVLLVRKGQLVRWRRVSKSPSQTFKLHLEGDL